MTDEEMQCEIEAVQDKADEEIASANADRDAYRAVAETAIDMLAESGIIDATPYIKRQYLDGNRPLR